MRNAHPCEEEDVSTLIRELRRKQGSLKKAIDRKNDDIDRVITAELQSTPEPEMLLQEDIEEIAQTIKIEEQEAISAHVSEDIVSNSRSSSPEIPICLPGLNQVYMK